MKILLYFNFQEILEASPADVSKILEAAKDEIEFCREYALEHGCDSVTDIVNILPMADKLEKAKDYSAYKTETYYADYLKGLTKVLENNEIVVILPYLTKGSNIPAEEKTLCFNMLNNVREWNDLFGGRELRKHIEKYCEEHTPVDKKDRGKRSLKQKERILERNRAKEKTRTF